MKQTDEAVFKKKLLELASRANGSGRCTFTPFLGLAEQNILRCAEKELSGVIRTEFGGADGCERIMVRFGDPEDCGYACPFPIRCIRAIPRSKKFAEQLTHRDILGSLMALGIDRNRTGDIAVRENEIYIFCTEQIAPYIAEKFRFRTANGSQLRYSAPAGHYGRERFARASAAAGIAFHPSHRAMQCCKRKA